MTRNVRTRSTGLATIILGSAAMLLFAPGMAWAGSGHDHRGRDIHHGHFNSHAAYHYHVDHKRNHPHGKRRGHEKHHVGFYCKPCNHYFSARDQLYDHVAYRHRVPYRRLSVAVSFGAFGWIFFG